MSFRLDRWLASRGPDGLPTLERSRRRRVLDRMLRDAQVVEGFLKWIDTINSQPVKKLSEEQVFLDLEQLKAHALSYLPADALAKAEDYLRLRDQLLDLDTQVHAQGHNADDEISGNYITDQEQADAERLVQLSEQIATLAIEDDPDALLAKKILYWCQQIKKVWPKIAAYRADKKLLLKDVNAVLTEHKITPLPKDVSITYTPLGIIFLVPDSMRISGGFEDFRGIYFFDTPFIFIKRQARSGTVHHELGHAYSDYANEIKIEIIPNLKKIVKATINQLAQAKLDQQHDKSEQLRQALRRQLRVLSIDWLREEILAEANSKREPPLKAYADKVHIHHYTDLVDDPSHWRTAEFDATATLPVFIQSFVMPRLEKLGETSLFEFADHVAGTIESRFERLKQALNYSFGVAKFLPDPDAQRYLASLITVTPVRMLSHLPEAVLDKYGREAVDKAACVARIDELVRNFGMFEDWDQAMCKPDVHDPKVIKLIVPLLAEYSDQDKARKIFEAWHIDTIQDLLDKVAVMQSWPKEFSDLASVSSLSHILASRFIERIMIRAAKYSEIPDNFSAVVLGNHVLLGLFKQHLQAYFELGYAALDFGRPTTYSKNFFFKEQDLGVLAKQLDCWEQYTQLVERHLFDKE